MLKKSTMVILGGFSGFTFNALDTSKYLEGKMSTKCVSKVRLRP